MQVICDKYCELLRIIVLNNSNNNKQRRKRKKKSKTGFLFSIAKYIHIPTNLMTFHFKYLYLICISLQKGIRVVANLFSVHTFKTKAYIYRIKFTTNLIQRNGAKIKFIIFLFIRLM